MLKKHLIATLFAGTCFSLSALADLPTAGTLMNAVAAEYGDPTDKPLPIGQPPITRWIYDSFTVVFEHDHVVAAFPRLGPVENRPLTDIPERPEFVDLIDQSRNKPEAKVEAVQLLENNVSAFEEKKQIEEADQAAKTVEGLEMATP